MMRMLIMTAMLALAGCGGFKPRVETDRSASSYQKDLLACQDGSAASVDKQNVKTGLAWISSPVRRPFQVRRAIRACLIDKGYVVPG